MCYTFKVKQICFTGEAMKVEDKVRLLKLFDLYGNLLSKGQQEIMSCYLNNDLTISEIAENINVSRQAVNDSITKGERKLDSLEKKLKLCQRIDDLEKQLESLENSDKKEK